MSAWSAEQKLGKILVRPEYLDLTGDLVTGVLLSQVVYWFRPKASGKSAASIIRDNRLWVAKTQDQWCTECRIGLWQFQQALKSLKALGVVETRNWKFGGRPVLHLSLDIDRLMALVTMSPPNGVHADPQQQFQGAQGESDQEVGPVVLPSGNPTVGKPDGPLSGNQKINCVETTGSSSKSNLLKESPKAIAPSPALGQHMATLKEITEAKAHDKHGREARWKALQSQHQGSFQFMLTGQERGQLKLLESKWPSENWPWMFENWHSICAVVKAEQGLNTAPSMPVIGWCLKYAQSIARAMAELSKKPQAKAQVIGIGNGVTAVVHQSPEAGKAVHSAEQIAKDLEDL